MALGGLCGLVRLDGAPVAGEAVASMARASPWRSAGGVALSVGASAAFASVVPAGAEGRPAAGLAEAGPLRAVVDARLVGRAALAAALGSSLLPRDREPTDAELILAAYRRWGEECPDRLLGDFAFAIWDDERRELFSARDPVGARPLCYAVSGPTVRIASSPLQVLEASGLGRDLDGYALLDFLTGNFRDQARTFFAAVRKLLPGHTATFATGRGPRAHRYWHPERAAIDWGGGRRDRIDWIGELRELLRTVVAEQLADAGAEVALMTSGGLDSSTLAAVAGDLHREGRLAARPVAFTYVFHRLEECDEWAFASALADEAGVEIERIVADDLSDLAPAPDREGPEDSPVTLPGELAHRALATIHARGCRAVTTGFGGDSLFDAARWQVFDHVRRGRLDRAWPWVVGAHRGGAPWPKAAAAVLAPPLLSARRRRRLDRALGRGRYWQVPPWLASPHRHTAEERLEAQGYPRRFRSFARQRQYEHVVGLAQQGQAIESWVADGARRGVEARFPLLDRRLAELVLAAPLELEARPGPAGSKWLLREAVAGILPETIRRRSDKGSWSAATRDALCHRLAGDVARTMATSRLVRLGLVDGERFVETLGGYCSSQAPRSPPSHQFVSCYLLERWLRSPGVDGAALRFEPLEAWQGEGMV